MSKCRELDALFAPYADGEVATEERASVEAHLERCPPCRDRVAIQRTVRGAMATFTSSLCSNDRLSMLVVPSTLHSSSAIRTFT